MPPLPGSRAAGQPSKLAKLVWDLHDARFMDLAGLHLLFEQPSQEGPPGKTTVTNLASQPLRLLALAAEVIPPSNSPTCSPTHPRPPCSMTERGTARPRCVLREVLVGRERAQGIVVCHTGYPDAAATAELTWALVLAAVRNLPAETRDVREGGRQTSVGTMLEGKTLGLLGLGRLGSRVAKVGQAFGMETIARSRHLSAEKAAEHGVTAVTGEELFARSDVLSIHMVLSERSRGLVGAAVAKPERSRRVPPDMPPQAPAWAAGACGLMPPPVSQEVSKAPRSGARPW